MTYDAALVARRGLGADELLLASAPFAAAVRWAFFAEKVGTDLAELRAAVALDPPDGLGGQPLMDFIAQRRRLRAELASREAALLLDDADA